MVNPEYRAIEKEIRKRKSSLKNLRAEFGDRPYMPGKDEARKVIRQVFNTETNLIPDEQNKQLIVELHNLTSEYADQLANILCQELNNSRTIFPGTDMEIIYKLVSQKNRPGQEV